MQRAADHEVRVDRRIGAARPFDEIPEPAGLERNLGRAQRLFAALPLAELAVVLIRAGNLQPAPRRVAPRAAARHDAENGLLRARAEAQLPRARRPQPEGETILKPRAGVAFREVRHDILSGEVERAC